MSERDEAFVAAVRRVAADVAAIAADDVDRLARFPIEAIDALREARALSACVAPEFGGEGVSFFAIGRACEELARRCAATGMVFAMHAIQLGAIARHGPPASRWTDYLRELCREQWLIASVTSEVGVGGDLRSSICAVERQDETSCTLKKSATTISYGAQSDQLLVTARRAPEAGPGDQVLVLLSTKQVSLASTTAWDSLGMRGTCSPGFVVTARFPSRDILPTPFATIAARTMVPWSHLLWSHVWLGIAGDAFDRAHAFVRSMARRNPGATPPMAGRLSELSTVYARMRAHVAAESSAYLDLADSPDGAEELESVRYAIRINNLKIGCSELVGRICQDALVICGMAGYMNGTAFSVGRHLRDALSAPLMIGNDRIHATNARLWTVHKADS